MLRYFDVPSRLEYSIKFSKLIVYLRTLIYTIIIMF